METAQDWIANIAILNAQLRKESWYNTFWAKFSGNVDLSMDDNGNVVKIPSGKPIEVLNAFIEQGRDNMLIPFRTRLKGDPVYGDTVLKGTGEDQSLRYLRSYVNQYRKAVMKRSGKMSEQRQKLYKLFEAALPDLRDWMTQWENQAIFQAFYEGVSPNLSVGTSDDGLGLARRYHPNWYINDGAVLTKIGTEKKFKTNAQLDTAIGMTAGTAGTCDTAMTAAILWKLRTKCMQLRIPQLVTKSGFKFWPMIVHPQQFATLMADSTFLAAQRAAFTGKLLELPELTGSLAYYAGFVFYEDIVGIREWDEAGYFFGATTEKRFDPTEVTLHNDAGSKRIYNALIFGNQAMGKGVASDLKFTKEIDDHENTIEIGGAMINGYNRAEFLAEADAGEVSGDAFYKNQAAAHDAAALLAICQGSLIFSTCEA